MCYSAKVSLITFIVALIFSVMLFTVNDPNYKIIGLFLGFISLMQGIEFLLWKHQVCDTYHKSVSIMGMLLNHLQPLVLTMLLLHYNTKLSETNKKYIYALIVIYLVIMIPYSLQYVTNKNLQCTTQEPGNPHLIWNWNSMKYNEIAYVTYIIAVLILPLLGMPNKKMGKIVSGLTLITYLFSAFVYKRQVVGALWCYYSALLPVFMYGYYLTDRNKV